MKKVTTILVLLLVLTGCATKSKNITADSKSPFMYQSYSCDMLYMEYDRVADELAALCKKQDSSATTDTVMMTVGLVVFWPALLALPFTDDEKEKIAMLKGEKDALEQAMTMNKCNIPKAENTDA